MRYSNEIITKIVDTEFETDLMVTEENSICSSTRTSFSSSNDNTDSETSNNTSPLAQSPDTVEDLDTSWSTVISSSSSSSKSQSLVDLSRWTTEDCYLELDKWYKNASTRAFRCKDAKPYLKQLAKLQDAGKKPLFERDHDGYYDLHNHSRGMAYYFIMSKVARLKVNESIKLIPGKGNHSDKKHDIQPLRQVIQEVCAEKNLEFLPERNEGAGILTALHPSSMKRQTMNGQPRLENPVNSKQSLSASMRSQPENTSTFKSQNNIVNASKTSFTSFKAPSHNSKLIETNSTRANAMRDCHSGTARKHHATGSYPRPEVESSQSKNSSNISFFKDEQSSWHSQRSEFNKRQLGGINKTYNAARHSDHQSLAF